MTSAALAGAEDFDEVGQHRKLDQLTWFAALMHGRGWVGAPRGFAAGDDVLGPDAAGHGRERESIGAAAHVAAGIAVSVAADEDLVDGGSGDAAQLSKPGNGLCETPVGRRHSALNDAGKVRYRGSVSGRGRVPR